MSLKISELEKTVSPAGEGYWVQVHDYIPERSEEKKKRGRLVAILGVTNVEESETMKLVELGREVLAFLHEQYYGELETRAMDRLKIALNKVMEEFGVQIEVVTLVELDEVMYVGVGGGAKVYANLDEGSGFLGNEEKDGVRVFSGWKKLNTKLVLGTKNFWEKIGEGRIKALLESDKSCREIADELAVVIGSEALGSGMGGVMIRIGETGENEIAEIETEEEVVATPKLLETTVKWKTGITSFWGQTRGSYLSKMNWGLTFVVLLVTLIIGGGIWRKYVSSAGTKVQEQIAEIEQKLNEASLLADTNSSRARELLESIKPEIEGLSKLKSEKVIELREKVKVVEEVVAGIVRLDFKEAEDLALIREGFVATKMKKAGKKLLVLDVMGGRLVSYDTEKEKGEVVLGGEALAGTRMVAGTLEAVYVIGSYGVKECLMVNWKCSEVIKGEEVSSGVTDVASWTGNLYMLDGEAGRIWKYAKQGTVFGKKTSWMNADTILVGADSLAIDGRIWTGLMSGGVGKFNQGVKENFEISGMSEPFLSKTVKVYASDDETKIYVLDTNNKRIVVLEKDGSFVKQYVADKIEQATGFAIYEDKAKIYLSSGSKIYVGDIL